MFVRLALVSGFAASLLQSVACYRINVKSLMDKKLGSPVGGKAAKNSTAKVSSSVLESMPQNQTITNGTALVSDNVVSSLLNHVEKHDEMPHFMMGTHSYSKRTIGNVLASVGLMRARLVLSMTSTVLPASLAEKILSPAFLQQENAELPSDPTSDMSFATKGAGFLIVVAVIFLVSKGLFGVALSSKMLTTLADGEAVDAEEVRATILLVVKYAIPQIVGAVLYMVNEIVSTLSIGHAGTKEQLAAVGLCNMMMNAFLFSLTFGLLGPLDSLVSSAWGAGDKELCITFLNKARLVGFAQALWLVPLFWFAEPLLLQLGQDPAVAENASGFCKVMGLMYIPFFSGVSLNFFLKNIGDPMIGVVGLFVGNFVHIAGCLALVVHGGWGNLGIVCAWAVNQTVVCLIQAIYVATKSAVKDQSWLGLFFINPRMCTNTMAYLKLAIPSILAQGCESWFWEAVTMIVGTMSATALAAHVATNNLQGVLMMGPIGLTGASATIVGSILGAGNIGLIRVVVKVLPVMACSIWAVIFALLIAFRHELARVYCDEADVRNLMASLLAIVSFSGFFNSMQAITSGCLKAMAQQKVIAYIVVFNYYLIALPLSYILGVKMDYGVKGVYASFLVGLVLMFLSLTHRAWSLDLKRESENARARMEAGKATK